MKMLARSALASIGLLSFARQWRGRILNWSRSIRLRGQDWWNRGNYYVSQVRYRHAAAGFPIPPAQLNILVSGTTSVPLYVEVGQTVWEAIIGILARNGRNIRNCRAILDFGCGSGRVIRYWKGLPAAVHGTDCHVDAIRWCADHLPFCQFRVNQFDPPLAYRTAQVDFIYAISVFTHLDEQRQHAWIEELTRVLKPGGLLLITTHGDSCLHYLSDVNVQRFRSNELVVTCPEKSGSNECGIFHPSEYVRSQLARNLSVVDFVPGRRPVASARTFTC